MFFKLFFKLRPELYWPLYRLCFAQICFALTFAAAVQAELPNWGSGPVELENQYELSVFHSSWSPRSPQVLPQGQARFELLGAWSNNAVFEDNFAVDVESRNFYPGLAYSPLDNIELAVRFPLYWRGAGTLDSFIDAWHEFFHLPEGDRNRVPEDDYSLRGQNSDGSQFSIDSAEASFGSPSFAVKYLLSPGNASAPAWSLEGIVSLPSFSESFGHEGVDLTAAIIGAERWQNLSAYWGAAYIFFTDEEIYGIGFEQQHAEGFAALEYQIISSISVYSGLYFSSEIIDSVVDHPGHFLYLDIGGKMRLADDVSLNILVRENPSPSAGSTDFSLVAGVTVGG